MSRMSKTAAVRAGGILGGAGLLFVGGVLVASSPAFADNGPHVSMTNTNTSSTTTGIGGALGGGCASCHRAHTAQATTDLLVTTDEVALCESCHGASGNGATTDVVDGVGYAADVSGNRTGTPIGALRGGGFTNAAIDSTNAVRGYPYANGADWRISKGFNVINPLVTLGAPAPAAATSNHGVGVAGSVMWGNGAISASANYGKSGVTLECSSCHNPHGNGNFRILNPVPTDSGVTMPTFSAASYAGNDVTFTLTTPYPFAVGQTVTVTNANPVSWNISKGTITSVSNAADYNTTFNVSAIVVKATTPPVAAWTSGGTITPQFPDVSVGTPGSLAITSAAYTATSKYIAYTVAANTLPAGRKVTVTGFTNAAYNVVNATVVASTATSFSVAVATDPGAAAGQTGSAQSAAVAYNYTTANYWQNDPNGQAPVNAVGKDSYIANVSQWCSTCHSRYLSPSGSVSRVTPSGDAVFKYRHTSANGAQDSPNCIQCHVAHGTNATMSGVSNSTAADSPGASPNGDHGSKLLRVANRGVCQMCHDK